MTGGARLYEKVPGYTLEEVSYMLEECGYMMEEHGYLQGSMVI